jgi:hypothetical protein
VCQAGAISVSSLGDVTPRTSSFAKLDDWELLLELHNHERPWDGMITTDRRLPVLPKEMVVLRQTHLTLVVANGLGDNPIRATGVLLAHIDHICHHTCRDRSQIWDLHG